MEPCSSFSHVEVSLNRELNPYVRQVTYMIVTVGIRGRLTDKCFRLESQCFIISLFFYYICHLVIKLNFCLLHKVHILTAIVWLCLCKKPVQLNFFFHFCLPLALGCRFTLRWSVMCWRVTDGECGH